MKAAGFTPEDFAHEVFEVWPENWPVFLLFDFLQTQWRVGMNGAGGLDYNVLYRKLDRMALPPEEYDQMEADIAWMERAAMVKINEKKD